MNFPFRRHTPPCAPYSCVRFHWCIQQPFTQIPRVYQHTTALVLFRAALPLLGCHPNSYFKHHGAEIMLCRENAKQMGKTWFEGFWHQGTLLNFICPLWISCTHPRCCWHRLLKPTQDTLVSGQAPPHNPGGKRQRCGHSRTPAGCGTHKDFVPGNMLKGIS